MGGVVVFGLFAWFGCGLACLNGCLGFGFRFLSGLVLGFWVETVGGFVVGFRLV